MHTARTTARAARPRASSSKPPPAGIVDQGGALLDLLALLLPRIERPLSAASAKKLVGVYLDIGEAFVAELSRVCAGPTKRERKPARSPRGCP